ncbi:HlyD family efflux transporter periplasmic adaptor subunit [Microbacterium rhizomatis]|uniref:HlyD family efflux transporter periplasmic adaptor subunit n=1 Tax=Microbacterium rhizomatis TaxID=1631477 RepID=A0A5J5J2L4_9MICO|nr:HlyD family efflux transporter periplasmic adaptor subunit [Microbacterium rhizomatis]KAA9107919.1 HlyD family efflux transporter periplasmic adaptor subunit [Microbacterium rhizomatis]
MSSPLYRPAAVQNLASPEQLDTVVRVTRPRGWIALSAVGLVLVTFVVWCFVGTVRTTVPAAGMVLTPYGTFSAVATEAGQITEIFVSAGDHVTAGAPVATVHTADAGDISVLATANGTVTELLAYPNDRVDAGQSILTVQPADEQLRVFAFVAVAGSQPIKPGMPVQISVTTVPSEVYGLLQGTVTKVGAYPATRAGVNALLHNDDITSIVVGGPPVFQVEVALTPASTPSGFAWTFGDGPPDPIVAGTLVNATVITAVEHPISLLFPSDRTAQ